MSKVWMKKGIGVLVELAHNKGGVPTNPCYRTGGPHGPVEVQANSEVEKRGPSIPSQVLKECNHHHELAEELGEASQEWKCVLVNDEGFATPMWHKDTAFGYQRRSEVMGRAAKDYSLGTRLIFTARLEGGAE